jgi:hypothetical protein
MKVLVNSLPTSLALDWRDRSFLELFGEWLSCWLTLSFVQSTVLMFRVPQLLSRGHRLSGREGCSSMSTPAHNAYIGRAKVVAGQSNGRSEVVVLVREVMRLTAVHLANCGGRQRPYAISPNKES